MRLHLCKQREYRVSKRSAQRHLNRMLALCNKVVLHDVGVHGRKKPGYDGSSRRRFMRARMRLADRECMEEEMEEEEE